MFEYECVFPSLARLTSCLLSDMHPVALQSLLTFDLGAVAPQSDSLCWISVWKRLSVLAGLEGLQITKNTKQTKPLASAPFDRRSPLSPEDLLRKPNPALVLFLLFADFRGFGLRWRVALEQRFLHSRSLKHNKRGAGACGSLSLALMQKADVESCGSEHESGVWLQTDGCESSLQGRRWKLNVLTLELQEVLHV